MTSKLLPLIAVFLIVASCKKELSIPENRELSPAKEYTLVLDDDSIWVEEFDSLNTDINKYNHNNTIFKVGSTFTYNFTHITTEGDTLYFTRNPEDWKDWQFTPTSDITNETITSVKIAVVNGNPMADHIPDYNQTVISYRTGNAKNYSTSGVIENEGNVWMHPPRDAYFRILELNPFPYIKTPYEIGTSWTWDLTIGAFWGDTRWKTWEGSIENQYQYEITGKETITTALGEISCFVIDGKATSRIGNTALRAYFNGTYGFVKLDYTNIDNSKTHLELGSFTAEK